MDTEKDLKNFFPELASEQVREMMAQETVNGLLINPYNNTRRSQLTSEERARIIHTLIVVQSSALISDFALLISVYMFDKVMEGVSLLSAWSSERIVKREFKVAAVCLFLAAKLEDPKYPYFDCFLKVLLDKTLSNP